MKAIVIGAAIAALAGPAAAQMVDGPGKLYTQTTRADAEAKAKARFAERDLDHDGYITPEEIHAGIEKRMADARGRAFDRIDTDRNGTISREEFSARHDGPGGKRIVERRIERVTPDGAKDGADGKHEMRVMMMRHGGPDGGGMILMSDADKDGRISQAEAVAGALKMFDQSDANHDGTVTMEERHAAMEAWGAKMRERTDDMPPPPPPPPPPVR